MSGSTTSFRQILQHYWGYDDFRPLQEDIIQSISSGKDTLALMPTGGGKSITFQVPAMAAEGLCLVVTPLIALMHDQVENLKERDIKAAYICTGMTRSEILSTLDNCTFGNYKFLYVSPERLNTELFLKRLPHIDVCMIAVDEAHCISQWGYDFRPSYLNIADIRQYLPQVPILALTATATQVVIKDIQQKLLFRQTNVFSKSFERKNLAYVVRETEDKLSQLLHILNSVQGSAIIYVRSRKKTKEIADFLRENTISADYFHAGLTSAIKGQRQQAWKDDRCRVMVSTNAFGMGIDKPDVRLVIHMDLPDSLEAYFQEAGRAGRDGKKAFATLLYNKSDSAKLKKRISDAYPEKEWVIQVYNSLGNYYQIAAGSGYQAVFPFDLNLFCSAYHFPLNSAYHALKIMQQAGFIELTDELDNPSRLMIIATKEDLYHIHHNQLWENILQTTLRSYTGLFAELVHISEEAIAQRAGVTRQEVYDCFSGLGKEHIVEYIPAAKTPFVSFTQAREDVKHIRLGKAVYDDRKAQFSDRINAMLAYVNEQRICRSRQLLAYFGQRQDHDCGICDCCLRKKSESLSSSAFERYCHTILSLLQEERLTIRQLHEQTDINEKELISTVRFLQDNGTLAIINGELVI